MQLPRNLTPPGCYLSGLYGRDMFCLRSYGIHGDDGVLAEVTPETSKLCGTPVMFGILFGETLQESSIDLLVINPNLLSLRFVFLPHHAEVVIRRFECSCCDDSNCVIHLLLADGFLSCRRPSNAGDDHTVGISQAMFLRYFMSHIFAEMAEAAFKSDHYVFPGCYTFQNVLIGEVVDCGEEEVAIDGALYCSATLTSDVPKNLIEGLFRIT